MEDAARPISGKAAILIFANAQQRDLRRRGLPASAAGLLALPHLHGLAAPADLHWFTDRPTAARPAGWSVHRQQGRNFAERLENAVEDLARRGYDRIVILGRDCPELTAADVDAALALLQSRRLVLGPDHRGGCWLIAIHAADRTLLHGIRWERNTDAGELCRRFGDAHATLLATKFDLDDLPDLFILARVFLPAAAVLAGMVGRTGGASGIVLEAEMRRRVALQRPPPHQPPPLVAARRRPVSVALRCA